MVTRSSYVLRGLSSAAAILSALAATAAFAAGPKAYVGNFKDNTVSVIDTEAGKVVATVPVAAGPHGMAITQDGRTVYVSGDGSSSVDVIDTATDKVVKTINVGKAPNGVALTPDDRLLVVTVYGEDGFDQSHLTDAELVRFIAGDLGLAALPIEEAVASWRAAREHRS